MFNKGALIKLNFPQYIDNEKLFIKGIIEYVSEAFLFMKTLDGTIVKISYKDFDLIEVMEREPIFIEE